MINAGTIEAIAMFKHNNPNYNDIPNKTATLTINKARFDISNITFTDKTEVYDGNAHTITIDGELPAGVSVNYSTNNTLTDVGSVTVTASFSHSNPNYEEITRTLTATLKVKVASADEVTVDTEFDSYEYTANPIEPNVIVLFNGSTLDDSNYTIRFVNNTAIGEASVEVTLSSNLDAGVFSLGE